MSGLFLILCSKEYPAGPHSCYCFSPLFFCSVFQSYRRTHLRYAASLFVPPFQWIPLIITYLQNIELLPEEGNTFAGAISLLFT